MRHTTRYIVNRAKFDAARATGLSWEDAAKLVATAIEMFWEDE